MSLRGTIRRRIAYLFCFLGGCGAPHNAQVDTTKSMVREPSQKNVDLVWESIQTTLREYGFRLDRVDRRAGIITTFPEGSPHYFEFWRKDVATAYDLMESTLNPIRRRVEVTLVQSEALGLEGQAVTEVGVAVYKQRLSSPDRQFNNSGAAYQFFGNSLPSTTGITTIPAEQDRWLDLGRDRALEHRLSRSILGT